MKAKLSNAVKIFYSNASLEMVYLEAVSNALDANATSISIDITAEEFSKPQSITIKFEDNGVGFTDERFKKFSQLFDVDESTHRGLGRLVYLCYFKNIHVESYYEDYKQRIFDFSENFDEKSTINPLRSSHACGSKFTMEGYTLARLGQYNFIKSSYLKDMILSNFYARLYKEKQNKNQITISLFSHIGDATTQDVLDTNNIPAFTKKMINNPISLFSDMELYYRIDETDKMEPASVITAISVDDRTYNVDIIAKENLPISCKMIFLLFSNSFNGRADASRQALTFNEPDMQAIKKILRDNIAQIIKNKIPRITQRNQKTKENLMNSFPHLSGYFKTDEIGFSSQNDVLKDAQEKFFREQRNILDAPELTNEQFDKSIELSSRALTEYILFRQIVINKLKSLKAENKEQDIHNLIAPKGSKFNGYNIQNDLYNNCVWILDDKYMTYDTILSDVQMTDVIETITKGEIHEKDNDRPDITLIFSDDPAGKGDKKVDVVIVELKRKGLSVENNSIVEVQLENRARKLMSYYPDKIQQIWFYGIIDINDEYKLHLLSDGYHSLYSKGKVYYRTKDIVLQDDPIIKIPVGTYIMDLNAVINDAECRNSTFLNIIKNKFGKIDE